MMKRIGMVMKQMARTMARLPDFLPWLGGADKTILAQVPQERARFVQMALVLLTTSSIAMVSMIFAMNDGVKAPLAVAVLVGVFWAFIILNLDRFLVLSMGATRAGRRLFLMAVPRILLATVISIVIATPLTLRIFQHDINVEIAKSQATESKQLKGLIAQSGPAQEASQVQDKITADEQILAGRLPVNVTNPQLQDAQAQVNQLQPKVAQASRRSSRPARRTSARWMAPARVAPVPPTVRATGRSRRPRRHSTTRRSARMTRSADSWPLRRRT
jgi:hypothetical protein